jgi:glycosyltransferase involved in cell wall biosynthesis
VGQADSIFAAYYTPTPFEDRFMRDSKDAVDVIIPIIHTNELWKTNLLSIYREVPVNRLLISDGGCKDDSITIAQAFPRVVILDHKEFKSLGYCLRKLIEAVETEWFLYLHSDVFLPSGWFDAMRTRCPEYDWFGCVQQITALVQFARVDKLGGCVRPYAGSQMGRKAAFEQGLPSIDDDYVYRQEDFVLASLVEGAGFRVGNIDNAFFYHQVMHKESPWSRKIKSVSFEVEWSREEQIRASSMQVKGIVKYLQPSSHLLLELEAHLTALLNLASLDWQGFQQWVEQTNPAWSPYIRPRRIELRRKVHSFIPEVRKAAKKIVGLIGL